MITSRERGGIFGRLDMLERIEARPAVERVAVKIDEAIAETARHAESAVVGGAAADADDEARSRMLLGDAQQQLAEAKRVEFEGMERPGGSMARPMTLALSTMAVRDDSLHHQETSIGS